MNAIRLAITAFVVGLLLIVGTGWRWTSRNQPPAKATASHVVLGVAAIAGLGGLVAVWRPRHPPRHHGAPAPTGGEYDAHG